jgi:hypothetical protein
VFGKIYELSHRVSFPDQDDGSDALPAVPAAAQSGRAEAWAMGIPGAGTARTHKYEPGTPRPTPRRAPCELGHAARERRQGLHVHVACGQCLPERIFCPSTRAMCARTPLADIYRNAPIFQVSARYEQAGGQVRRMRVQGDLRRLACAGLCGHRRSAGAGALLHLPAEELGPGAGTEGRELPRSGGCADAGVAVERRSFVV